MEYKWYEDENFWETFQPVLFNEDRIKNTPLEVDKIINLLNIKEGSKILDLCCGVGRHSIELAKRGFTVIGVDSNEEYLKMAIKKSKKEKVNIEFIKDDMRNFYRENHFDIIINIFTSFGFFEDMLDDKKVIENSYISLKKDGKLLIDMNGKETLARIFRERDWYRVGDFIILEERKILGDFEKIETKWIIVKDDKIKEFTIKLRLYSAYEIKSLFKECGFSKIEIFGDLTGSPYDNKASRLIVVGTK